MIRLIKYLSNLGRKQAYLEILHDLEELKSEIPNTREGAIYARDLTATIKKIKANLELGKS